MILEGILFCISAASDQLARARDLEGLAIPWNQRNLTNVLERALRFDGVSAMEHAPLDVLHDEAIHIVEEGSRRGLLLRASGGIAYYLHAHDRDLFHRLGRDAVNDVDLVGVSRERNDYKQLFKDLGYEVDWDLLVAGEGKRFLFQHVSDPRVEVDLFIDRLDMCHRIELRDRLSIQEQTISLVDLLLQKLQIVELNEKDMVDVVVLLAEHEVDGEGPEAIDAAYAAGVLGDDWGFYYTTKQNLDAIRGYAATAALPDDRREAVARRLDELEGAIEQAPKSRRWRMRARIGPKRKWYQDVEDATDAF